VKKRVGGIRGGGGECSKSFQCKRRRVVGRKSRPPSCDEFSVKGDIRKGCPSGGGAAYAKNDSRGKREVEKKKLGGIELRIDIRKKG